MSNQESGAREHLDAYWDEVVRGRPRPEPTDGDQQLVALLHDLYRPPLPTPHFRDRLRKDITMAATSPVSTTSLLIPERLFQPAGPSRSLAAPVLPRRSFPARFASMAALILLLAAASLPFVVPRLGQSSHNLTIIPAFVEPESNLVPAAQVITGGDDPMESPFGVAIAPDGSLFVIDTARDQIRGFDADGKPKAAWGKSGDKPGEFGFSFDGNWADLAFAPNGNLFILDPNLARVQEFTPEGIYLSGWGERGSEEEQILYPMGIDIDQEGRVYIADWGNQRVQVFDAAGKHLASWDGTKGGGPPLAGPNDVAIAADGTAWVTDGILARVIGFAPDGTVVSTIGSIGDDPGELRGPWGIAVDAEGTLYVAEYDNDRIQRLSPDGTSLGMTGASGDAPGEFEYPTYLALAPDGSIVVSEEGNKRLQRIAAVTAN